MSRKLAADQVQELMKQPSNVLQGVCRMLQRECRISEVFVDEKFLPFYLYLKPFPSGADYHSDKPEDIFTNMKRFVLDKRIELATQKMVTLNTIKLQFFYLCSCFDLEEISHRNVTEKRKKGRRVLKQVLKMNPKTIEDRGRLLKRITTIVTIDNGLGEDKVPEDESEAAIKSVLSTGDLLAFVQMSTRDKVDVLEDLKVIVCGIRLFNNDAGHEKSKIIDLSLLLEKSFDNTRVVLEYEQELIHSHGKNVTEKILATGLLNASAPSLLTELHENHVNYLKDISLFVQQRYQLISSILSKLIQQKAEIFETINGFRKTLKDMHAILIYKTAINTKDIYPKFKLLGLIWKKMQLFVYFLSEINLFVDQLQSLDVVCDYINEINIPVNTFVQESAQLLPKKQPQQPLSSSSIRTCEYRNYCTWALCHGFILPVGDDQSNVLEFANRRYLFNSQVALNSFKREPEKYLLDIVKVLYDHPEIMLFLERTEELSHYFRLQDNQYRITFYGCKDMVCQTAPIKELTTKVNAVQEIKLLRRKGFQLANQVNYKNKATQTEWEYHGKYCSSTQTKDFRSQFIQTSQGKGIQTE